MMINEDGYIEYMVDLGEGNPQITNTIVNRKSQVFTALPLFHFNINTF